MALTRTTLSAACAASDTKLTVASATSLAIGSLIRIDGELLKVTKGYVAGSTSVPVLRGQDGTAAVAHATSAGVVHGAATDFAAQAPATTTLYPIAGRARTMTNVAATGSLTLPPPGSDHVVVLNGTSVIALTVPVPTKDLDGTLLYIAADGVAAHTVTFTGGIDGAGSAYDVITINATAPVLLGPFMALNSLWLEAVTVPQAGTVTNITAASA